MNIGHRIKVLREKSGKSQEAIAKKAGLSREARASLEQQRQKNPRLNTLFDITKACGARMSDLFPGESGMRYDDTEVGGEEHAEIYRKLREVLSRSKRTENVLKAAINAAYKEIKERNSGS